MLAGVVQAWTGVALVALTDPHSDLLDHWAVSRAMRARSVFLLRYLDNDINRRVVGNGRAADADLTRIGAYAGL